MEPILEICAGLDILRDHEPYKDLGDAFLDRLHELRVTKQLVHRLERLGYSVALQPSAANDRPVA